MQLHIKQIIVNVEAQKPSPMASALIRLLNTAQEATPEQRTTQNGPPAIGQAWEGQAGVYAGIMRGAKGQPDYHLIVPTAIETQKEAITWGGYREDQSDAVCEFDGHANTTALVGKGEGKHPAAEWAASLVVDGHSDLYLPSRRELRLCWVNVPELFADGCYWSSTQYSPYYAWCQGFSDGGQYGTGKSNELRARAVRRLFIE
jgi:hypothetical protein